jgi:RNA polymerase sigma factor (sigma-70 family)
MFLIYVLIEMRQNMSDQLLIKKAKNGDKAASFQLYELHEIHWFRICLRYGKNRSEARDIFQEGAAAIFKNLGQFDIKRGKFQSWSNRIIVNTALKYLKDQNWQESFEDLEVVYNASSNTETPLDKIALKELIALVQRLPLVYRLVFNMYVIEGYSHKEIAQKLKIPVATSKSRLSKAKKALRQYLEVILLK